jgi:hypothetical protein
MFSTGRFRLFVLTAVLAGCASLARAQAPSSDATLYRIFLRDGSTLVSYGEYARVADQVVLSMPIGAVGDAPNLQLLSIPSARVDWDKTDAYADAARAARYASTQGPNDYALLGEAVSRALTDISLTADPTRKVAMAVEARRNVTKWVAEHYGYRAEDVARMATLFDSVITDVRTASGDRNFDLSLIANMAAPPSVPLMAAPTVAETLEQGFLAARLVETPTERMALLRSLRESLASGGSSPKLFSLRTAVEAALAKEEHVDRQYTLLTRRMMRVADRLARSADVLALTRLSATVLAADDRLGHLRPQETASLLAALDARLDSARRLRLAMDQWAIRGQMLARYRRDVQDAMESMRAAEGPLEEIRQLAGPRADVLTPMLDRLVVASRMLAIVTPPAELEAAHSLLHSALQLATRAAQGRRQAALAGDMQQAWQASSAASGALMLFERANEELQRLTKAPTLR